MIKVNTIKGYEETLDNYLISKDGFVYSENIGAPLKSQDNGKGYLSVSLKLKGVRKFKHAYFA